MNEICTWSAQVVTARMANKTVSAREVMQAALDQIDRVNGAANAIVSLRDASELLAEAAAAAAPSAEAPLSGLPIAIKDLVNTKGLRTTFGTPSMAEFVPDQDDLLAARLKAAGAIVIGKTNTPEFGLGSNTFNPVHGITPNAYDSDRTCGGSSGGAAVALAHRMLALADGSDMMGSLRNPAAWNNVYGMRPSVGVVPGETTGEYFLHPMSTLGPMARTPEDLGLLLQVLAGPDPRTPHGVAFEASTVTPGLAGKRIGWLGDWGGAYAYEPGIMDLCQAGLRVLETAGAVVEDVPPPFPSERLWDSWTTLRSWAVGSKLAPLYEDPSKRDSFKEDAIWEISRGLAFSAAEVHAASGAASDWYRAAAELFARYDALVLPCAQVWPFPKDWTWPAEIAGRKMDTYHRWMEVMIPVSLIGLPAISLPAGFGETGLPMGMQLFGSRGSDAALLGMAQSYHEATDWPGTRPPA